MKPAHTSAAPWSLHFSVYNQWRFWCSACGSPWLTNDGLCHLCRHKESRPLFQRPVILCDDCGMDDRTPGHEAAPGHCVIRNPRARAGIRSSEELRIDRSLAERPAVRRGSLEDPRGLSEG